MEMLKKQSMASQVQVARKPSISSGTGNRGGSGSSIQSSQKLILKAVADADKSIAKKRRETRQKNVELDTIHMNRMKATIAARKFKSGQQEEDIDTNTSPPPMRKKVLKVSPVYEEIIVKKKKK